MMIEKLETRALLSATFPSLVGSYSGTFADASGGSGTVTLSVYAQVKGMFFAIVAQSDGMNAVINGRVSAGAVLKFNVKPNVLGRHGKGSGTFSNGTFNATEVIKGRGGTLTETLSVTKH